MEDSVYLEIIFSNMGFEIFLGNFKYFDNDVGGVGVMYVLFLGYILNFILKLILSFFV